MQDDAETQVKNSCERRLTSPSNSAWASPIVMVRKKGGSFQLCVDYCALNERTIKDAYPLPQIQDTLVTLSESKFFSTCDLSYGCWQIGLSEDARQKAAFCTRSELREWNVMPFGLSYAPTTHQWLMDRVLSGLQWQLCLIYLDDVIVLGSTVGQMLDKLHQVFLYFQEVGLKPPLGKCHLFQCQVLYLGHNVSNPGIATNPDKI